MRSTIHRYLAGHPFGAGVAATLAILLGATSLAAAAKHVGPYINGTIAYVATTAGPVIFGDNQGSGIGVESVTDTGAAAGAIALQGFGTSSTHASVGVNGAVLGPGSTALIGNANGTTGAASIGLEGFSANGEGVFAQSTNAGFVSLRSVDPNAFYDVRLSDSTTGNGMTSLLNTFGGAAVDGQDTEASSSFNVGVLGTTASGLFGLEGVAFGDSLAGVYGDYNGSGTGSGVVGTSSTGPGVFGTSTNTNGVWGQSTNTDGSDGFTSNPSTTQQPRSGLFGDDNSSDGGGGNFGVTGFSTNGVGVQGNTTNGPYGGVFSGFNGTISTGTNFGVAGACNGASSKGELAGSPDGFSVNWFVDCTGTIQTIVQGHHHLYRNSSYAQTTEPVLEDFGSGQLVNGSASVRLDPSFADAITDRAVYMVFITPDGDSRGLYVAHKTPQGFVVRESGGGSSDIAFDYRIVSRPAAATQSRMYAIATAPSLLRPGMAAPSRTEAARMRASETATYNRLNATPSKIAPPIHMAARWPIFEPRFVNGKLQSLPFRPTVVRRPAQPATTPHTLP